MSDEIVIELRKLADFIDADTYDECWEVKETARGKLLRAAAARLSELERENAELKRAIERILSANREIPPAALAGSGEK